MCGVATDQPVCWTPADTRDTNDTRESAAIYVCRDLLRERARLAIYDPQVSEKQIRSELEHACLRAKTGEISTIELRRVALGLDALFDATVETVWLYGQL